MTVVNQYNRYVVIKYFELIVLFSIDACIKMGNKTENIDYAFMPFIAQKSLPSQATNILKNYWK